MTNWLLVSSPDNFETSRARGFDIAGMKSRHRRKAERVAPGDRVVFYLVGVKSVGGLAEVTGTYFEDGTKIWESNKPGELYPFRFATRPLFVRDRGDYLPMENIVHALTYPKRWPPQHWTLAFQGNVHVLGDGDYEIIADALRQPVAGVRYHFFVCTNVRPGGHPLPSCGRRGSAEVFEAFQAELARRGWPPGVKVTPTGCLTPCQCGPNVLVYPEGVWYMGVGAGDVAEIVAAHLERGDVVERLLLPADVRLW